MEALPDLSSITLVGAGLVVVISWWTLSKLIMSQMKIRSYNKLREVKKKELYNINSNWTHQVMGQINDEDAQLIIGLAFEQLQQKLRAGELTAVKALHAFQWSAAKENDRCKFICEPIMEAEKEALRLDTLSPEERQRLPLFGIPISLKENYQLEKYDCTLGCVQRIHKPSRETALLVQMLRKQGAVPFIRTNIPQTCMAFDSTNPIYGKTTNPHQQNRSCGGSSGGEAAAIGAGASILGFGSDIGGSLRIPAAFCGIYSFKPTARRLTLYGDAGVDANERIVTVTGGPMARDVNGLIEAMKALSDQDVYAIDPYVPPVLFKQEELSSTKKLRIGYFHSHEPVAVGETCRRSMDISIEALKAAGHEVVYWEPVDFVWGVSYAFICNVFADGCEMLTQSVQYDTLEKHLKETVYLSYIPSWIKHLLASVGQLVFPSYMVNYLRASCGASSVADMWRLQLEIKEFRRKVLADFANHKIDALLCPAMPAPAFRLGECQDAISSIAYMVYINLLNFPSGIVPVTKVTSEDLFKDKTSFPANKDWWHSAMASNLVDSEGLPMCVQCVSLPFHEERVLRLMKELESEIGYDVMENRATS